MMKSLFVLIFVTLYSSVLVAETKPLYISHIENVKSGNLNYKNCSSPMKIQRISNKRGDITMIYDETLPDSIITAIEVAKSMWESKVSNKYPIYIEVLFESLGANIVAQTDVQNIAVDTELLYPTALTSQIKEFGYSDEASPDGYIVLNSDIEWNCNFANGPSSGYNMPTMLMRGIARCLGFGTSLLEEGENEFTFYSDVPTVFDNRLMVGAKHMTDYEIGSPEFIGFITSGEVYFKGDSESYKVYSPKVYQQELSLCTFDCDDSLMSYSLGEGNMMLSIDDKTIEVLNSIGWTLPYSALKISCEDISEDGLGSPYQSHTYSLIGDIDDITTYSWIYSIKGEGNERIIISTGSEPTFTTPPLSSSRNYTLNVNGDIEGLIECEVYKNGEKESIRPFSLNLETKPKILSVDNMTVNEGDYKFNLDFAVRYVGADFVLVDVEEEYSTTMMSTYIREPFYAHVHTSNINSLFYSWVIITAYNQYGEDVVEYEFEPRYKNQSHIEVLDLTGEPVTIEVIRIDGTKVYKGEKRDYKELLTIPGVYLIREYQSNGECKVSKVSKR